MNRRGFISKGLAALAGLVVLPVLAKKSTAWTRPVENSVPTFAVDEQGLPCGPYRVEWPITRLHDVLVLIADGTPDADNEIIDAATLIVPDEQVPMRRNYNLNQPCGWAQLRREGNRVYADLICRRTVMDG